MNIKEYVKDRTLLLDGGMGSLLQARGLLPGELPERWNISHSDVICQIHKDYFDSGSNLVCANTFGANALKFEEEELEAIICAALENAQRAREDSVTDHEKWVALDVGPLGRMLEPYGDLPFERAVEIFKKTVRLGAKYGADVIFIETMNDSYETKAALLAAKEGCCLPVFVSNAYGADGKLMTGADPLAMVALLEGMGADAIGVNCSLGPKALSAVVEDYLKYASVPVLVKPNAGLPRMDGGKTVYDLAPCDFAKEVAVFVEKGARLAGGCCGTTPAYIAALRDACRELIPLPLQKKELSVVSSYTHGVLFEGKPLLIGERINPTGKKRFKEALRHGDMEYLLNEGVNQQERGAEILDVNVGLPELDESALLVRAVKELQQVTDLPLQIDTADPEAMEGALRCYNGKAMVNSVNGKKESMDAVFPIVKKYGGLVVALTLDEEGIPRKAEGRVAIAEKILAYAQEFGLEKKDLVFDPLALTVSTDKNAAMETLRAVKMLHERGCKTSLGVSNVSFGLPQREVINSSFFTLAMAQGLSAAIMNPYSLEMMEAYHAYLTLAGLDDNCAGFLAFASTIPDGLPAADTALKKEQRPVAEQEKAGLCRAIEKGLKEEAARLTAELLLEKDALEIVKDEIVPALDRVGVAFEEKRVFLPGLLMSAEAAKASFEKIKEQKTASSGDKCAVVLATVKGDIHDIGKNIVKLLLENYGFAVFDLGKDAAPQKVLEAVLEKKAPLVGLSALMTTTVPAMEEMVELLLKKAPFCRIMVGGAVLTAEYAEKMGAHFYAPDAMAGVRFAEAVNDGLKKE